MEPKEHWDSIYTAKAADTVSWYRPHLDHSLRMLRATGLAEGSAVIDVGGGASTFVDDLLDRGHSAVTVLDISDAGLRAAQLRLGDRATRVRWICGDVTEVELPEASYDFWHDRAVFHFLCDQAARLKYVRAAQRALKPGGRILVAGFGPRGPSKCSGLDVVRRSADELHSEFGTAFRKEATSRELHKTPWGVEQEFIYCLCRLRG